jgi:hypothetical protein
MRRALEPVLPVGDVARTDAHDADAARRATPSSSTSGSATPARARRRRALRAGGPRPGPAPGCGRSCASTAAPRRAHRRPAGRPAAHVRAVRRRHLPRCADAAEPALCSSTAGAGRGGRGTGPAGRRRSAGPGVGGRRRAAGDAVARRGQPGARAGPRRRRARFRAGGGSGRRWRSPPRTPRRRLASRTPPGRRERLRRRLAVVADWARATIAGLGLPCPPAELPAVAGRRRGVR